VVERIEKEINSTKIELQLAHSRLLIFETGLCCQGLGQVVILRIPEKYRKCRYRNLISQNSGHYQASGIWQYCGEFNL
jgi:hypothetical protein